MQIGSIESVGSLIATVDYIEVYGFIPSLKLVKVSGVSPDTRVPFVSIINNDIPIGITISSLNGYGALLVRGILQSNLNTVGLTGSKVYANTSGDLTLLPTDNVVGYVSNNSGLIYFDLTTATYANQNNSTLLRNVINITSDNQTAINLGLTINNPGNSLLFLNGEQQAYGLKYNIVGSTLNWFSNVKLETTDHLELYYF